MKKIGEKIKNARENSINGRGMSQLVLAELIGINQTSLSEIEMGKTTPRKPTLIALSFVLNDDFGEAWLQEFFNQSSEDIKEIKYSDIADLLIETNDLSKESIQEMQPIWEMLRAEIKRRKSLEKNSK